MKQINRSTLLKAAGGFFVVFMIAALFSVTGFAENYSWEGRNFELYSEGDYQFIVLDEEVLSEHPTMQPDGQGAYITAYTGTAPSVAIPATLGGNTVKWIGYKAFLNNNSIQTVTVGENVKGIQTSAFEGCTGLQSVLISKDLRIIQKNAFRGCSALKTVTIQKGSALERIYDGAFFDCISLKGFAIPDGTEEIRAEAFYNCDSLEEIVLPNSVMQLGEAAFFDCDRLARAEIGDGIAELLTKMTGDPVWGSDKYFGTFGNCPSLASVTIGKNMEIIHRASFANSGLTEVVIPDNVRIIETDAFAASARIKTAVIGNGVTELGSRSFNGCSALEAVELGRNVRSIGSEAFNECDALKSIVIPSSVTQLGEAAFYSCDSLETAKIGNGITEIKTKFDHHDTWEGDIYNGTFENCVNLKNLIFGDGIKVIERESFAGTGLVDVVLHNGIETVGDEAFRDCPALRSFTVGNGVKTIGADCFTRDTALADISIGRGVNTIGDRAFRDCSALTYIFIPSNVTDLGAAAFRDCSNLETVVVGNGVTALKSAVEYKGNTTWDGISVWGTFCGCNKLSTITLGSGLVSIGCAAFEGASIKSITIPEKVSSLGYYSAYSKDNYDIPFYSNSNLENVYFTGNWPLNVGAKQLDGASENVTVHYIDGKTGFDALEYAKQTFTPVTVTFDNNNDDVFAITPETQLMSPAGDYVIEPIAPVARGYLFLGWYADKACLTPWDFKNTYVTSDTTLYAKWVSVSDTAPVTPEGAAAAINEDNTVSLTWSEVDGAVSYNVYEGGKKLNGAPVTECAYTVRGLEYNSTYEFTVTAVNEKGESAKSLVAAVNTGEKPDAPAGLRGDADGDGKVSAKDARLALRAAAKLEQLPEEAVARCDLNGDGKVTAAEAREILRFCAKLIDAL